MAKLQVLDFNAKWCGPCRAMAPAIHALMEEHNVEGSNVEIKEIDVDEDPTSREKFGISGIPTLVFLKDDVEVYRTSGAQPKDKIAKKINEILAS